MASQVHIVDVKDALVALLASTLAGAYGTPVDVKSIGKRDFSDDGAITMRPPAVRVRYAGTDRDPLHDNQRLTYQKKLTFEAWCFDSNKRSAAAERDLCAQLAESVEDQLAGARLNLADGSKTLPITLTNTTPLMDMQDPTDQLYIVEFVVEGLAQYTGANANPGGNS